MRIQIASDDLTGVKTAVWCDDKRVEDVEALQVNMSAYGLNSVVLKRILNDGTRVQLDLYGGEAFHELRKAALRVLASVESYGNEGLPNEVLDGLRTAVAKVQDEVAR